MIKTCKVCLLPSTYLNIELNSDGVCQHCNNYKRTNFKGLTELKKKIEPALELNTSKKYNCVVGFSGGRDSTYLLWYIVNVLNLRPLAVFSDDLFIPDIAYRNMVNTCKILNVELRIIKHDNLKKCITHHLNAWIKRPVPQTLTFINVGERIGYETLVEKEAIKEGVNIIFGGRTPFQFASEYKTDLMKIGYKGGRFSWMMGYLKQVMLNPSLALNLFCLKIQFREFMVAKWKKQLIKKYKLTIIDPFFDYIPWVESDLDDVLFNKLMWEVPKGVDRSRFGCEVDTLRQFLYNKTLGYNDGHVELSCLIRDEQITREEALLTLKSRLNISEDYIKYILTKAGVDSEKFLSKLYKKYPSHDE